jgi:hypothetical protein
MNENKIVDFNNIKTDTQEPELALCITKQAPFLNYEMIQQDWNGVLSGVHWLFKSVFYATSLRSLLH